MTLVPNPKYWGNKPNLDKVVFKFVPDTAAEFQAYKSGEVDGDLPAAAARAVDAIKAGLPDAKSIVHRRHRQLRGAVDQQRQGPARLD